MISLRVRVFLCLLLAESRLLPNSRPCGRSRQNDEQPSRAEQLFLAIIHDDKCIPAQVLAGLDDLRQVETTVLDVMNSRGFLGLKNSFSEDELLLPEGKEQAPALIGVRQESLPRGRSSASTGVKTTAVPGFM
jgi:hypothetical protein